MGKKIILVISLILSVALVAVACPSNSESGAKGPVVVGSKIDTEGALLSQMIIQMLRANEFKVTDKSQFGTTQIVRQAIINGELDIYPEYTGNGAFFFSETESGIWHDAEAGYQRVKELDKQANNIVWLSPAPANNTWAIAIPESLAETENIASLADFAAYVSEGGYVKLAGSSEFVTSPVALPAFEDAYGFQLTGSQLLVFASGDTAVTEKAAAEGTDGVNTAMAYGTDGSLAGLGLVLLTDPLNVQPVYEPAPIVRGFIFDRYPELATILNPVFESLDLETLRTLNGRIAVGGEQASQVAHDYLVSHGFLSS